MFWVYILRCADGSYYTGYTDNLERCIGQYQTQACVTREDALSAEMQIKDWSRKKKESMMRGDWTEVSCLAKSKSAHPSTGSGRTDLLLLWEVES
jgi:putative endonuclease